MIQMLLFLMFLVPQDPPAETVERVRQYLKSGEAEIAKSLADVDRPVLERAVRLALRPAAIKEAGTAVHEIESDVDPSVKITYHISIPEAAGKEGLYPLLLTLHGQGGEAQAWLQGRMNEFKERDFFILAPQAGKAGWGQSRLGHSHVLRPLEDALKRYPIDPNRVWLDGGSMGANGAWRIASLFPDRFAAVAPRGGAPIFVKMRQPGEADQVRPIYARNLRNLPIYWIVGAKDKGMPMDSIREIKSVIAEWGYDLTDKEMAEGGHEWFPDETPRVTEWMRKKARGVDPPEVRWSTYERGFNRAYWVEITEFAQKETLNLPVKDLDGNVIETRACFANEITLTANARKGNRIELRCEGVRRVRLWLNERLVDLTKPVTVMVKGKKVFEGRVEASNRTLLDEVRRRGDPSFFYPAQIEVTVP